MIDKSKTYKTRDGREVRIYATDGGGSYPVHGAICQDGGWKSNTWNSDGSWTSGQCRADLIEVKPRIKYERWVNVYPDNAISSSKTREEADRNAIWNRIACVKIAIDCEEGEGLCDH